MNLNQTLRFGLGAALGLGTTFCLSQVAAAQTRSQVTGSTLTKRTHTAFVRGDVGMQTYESGWAGSNATANAYNIKAGGYAGEERLLGFFVNSNRSNTAFPVNHQAIESMYNEFQVQGRLGFLSLSGIGAISDIKYSQDEAQKFHLVGIGYGGEVAVNVPLTMDFILNASAKSIQGQSTEKFENEAPAKVGNRGEYEASMKFNVLDPVLDLFVGYRYRTMDVSINDVSYAEKQSSPFAGMEMGLFF